MKVGYSSPASSWRTVAELKFSPYLRTRVSDATGVAPCIYSSTSARRICCLRWLSGIIYQDVLALKRYVCMILHLSIMIASSLARRLQIQNSTLRGGLSRENFRCFGERG